ncbi:MAG: sulfite exporter TauE/SafE family protein, partial [Pseudomonadales bacterium]|nr:sulfite exporter TauE/SafE family protein [Pseudomonadales bacterium]
ASGSGSIVQAIVFNHIQRPKEVFVATMAASALPLNIIKIGIFSAGAIIGLSDIPLILLLLVASFLGIQLGKKVLVKISQCFFEKLVRLMLLVLSIKLLYSAIV